MNLATFVLCVLLVAGVFWAGCFAGALDEFRERVVLTHGDNQHARDYLAAAELAKIKLGIGGRKP